MEMEVDPGGGSINGNNGNFGGPGGGGGNFGGPQGNGGPSGGGFGGPNGNGGPQGRPEGAPPNGRRRNWANNEGSSNNQNSDERRAE